MSCLLHVPHRLKYLANTPSNRRQLHLFLERHRRQPYTQCGALLLGARRTLHRVSFKRSPPLRRSINKYYNLISQNLSDCLGHNINIVHTLVGYVNVIYVIASVSISTWSPGGCTNNTWFVRTPVALDNRPGRPSIRLAHCPLKLSQRALTYAISGHTECKSVTD